MNKVLGQRRNSQVLDIILFGLDVLEKIVFVCPHVGVLASDHLIKYDAERPNICAHAIRLAFQNLWGHRYLGA